MPTTLSNAPPPGFSDLPTSLLQGNRATCAYFQKQILVQFSSDRRFNLFDQRFLLRPLKRSNKKETTLNRLNILWLKSNDQCLIV